MNNNEITGAFLTNGLTITVDNRYIFLSYRKNK